MDREITTVDMPTSIRIRALRTQISTCERYGTNTVLLDANTPVTLDYARHVLACLLEAQEGKPCPASGWERE